MKKKILIFLILLLIVLCAIGFWMYSSRDGENNLNNDLDNNQTIQNTNQGDDVVTLNQEDIEYKHLTISNIRITKTRNGEYEIRGNVKNNLEEFKEFESIKIITLNKNDEEIDVIGAQIKELEPNEEAEFFTVIKKDDLSDVTKIRIEEN